MAKAKRASEPQNELVPEQPLMDNQTTQPEPTEQKGNGTKKKAQIKPVPTALISLLKTNLETKHVAVKVTENDLQEICGTFIDSIIEMVKKGDAVTFKNKLAFKRVLRDERICKNPKTQEEIKVNARYVMTIDLMSALKSDFEQLAVDQEELSKQRLKKNKKTAPIE